MMSREKWLQCKQSKRSPGNTEVCMKEKKTAVITVRIPPSTKAVIDAETERKEWTTSKMAEKILTEWAKAKESAKE